MESLRLVQLIVLVGVVLEGVSSNSLAYRRDRRQFSGGTDVGYRSQSGSNYRPSSITDIKPCINIHEVANGQSMCAYSGCRLRCNPGYRFLDTEASRRVTLTCDHTTGRLQFRDLLWTPEMTVCSPVCKSPCLNGGKCVSPNQCSCSTGYSGDTCAEERMLGDAPYGGYQVATLQSNQRRVACKPGTHMPDGSTSVTLTYKDNSWFYPDGRMLLGVDQVTCGDHLVAVTPEEPYPALTVGLDVDDRKKKPEPAGRPHPLLAPTTSYVNQPGPITESSVAHYSCNPPCENGGECVADGVCSCPRGTWGPRCRIRVCSYPRFENDLHASLGGTLKRLKFECHNGYRTRAGRDRVVVLCVNNQWRLPSGKILVEEDVRCY